MSPYLHTLRTDQRRLARRRSLGLKAYTERADNPNDTRKLMALRGGLSVVWQAA